MGTSYFKNGGTAVVLVGTNGLIIEYKAHPQVLFIDTKKVQQHELNEMIPTNARGFIISDGVDASYATWANIVATKRDAPCLYHKTNQAVYEQLRNWLGGNDSEPEPEPEPTGRKYNNLKVLLPFIDFNKSNIVNARALAIKAAELNIQTSEASLKQFVMRERNKAKGISPPKRQKKEQKEIDISVKTLNDIIRNLEGLRDFIVNEAEENRQLRARVKRLKEVLEDE